MILILDTKVSLKLFLITNQHGSYCVPQQILLDAICGGIRYLNILVLGGILLTLISLPYL